MLSARRSAGDGAVGAHGLLPLPQAHLPPRPPPAAPPHPPKPPQDPGLRLQVKEEGYIDFLLRASLLLVSKDFPPEMQQHGTKMLQHLLKFRREELSSADLLSLTVELVAPRGEADTSSKTAHPKEQNKYRSSLLTLATNNNLRSLVAEETGGGGSEDEGAVDTTTSSKPTSSPRTTFLSLGKRPSAFGGESVDFSLALDPNFHSSPTSSSSSPPMPFKNLGLRPCVSEDERIDLSIALSCLDSDESSNSSSSLDSSESTNKSSPGFDE